MDGLGSILPTLFNTKASPRVGMLPRIWQRPVYRHGQGNPPGLEGGMPAWLVAEFTLAAQETQDTTSTVPAGFHLLSFMARSVSTADQSARDFRVQIYDVNRQIDMIPGKAINAGNIGGLLSKIFFLPEPYLFRGPEPTVQIRVANMATVETLTTFVLYGTQGVQ